MSGVTDVDGSTYMAGGYGLVGCAASAILSVFDAHEGYVSTHKPPLHKLARLPQNTPERIEVSAKAKLAIALLKQAAELLEPGCVERAEKMARDSASLPSRRGKSDDSRAD